MKILLAPLGSHGDVHPFVSLGVELKRRGHDVLVVACDHYEPLVRRVGLPFECLFTAESHRALLDHPDLWHPSRGPMMMMRWITTVPLRPMYEMLRKHVEPGKTLVVHSPLGVGARLLHETHGVPLVTVHLAPLGLRSIVSPPRQPLANLPSWSPRWLKRAFYRLVDWRVDPVVCPEVNRFRAELGLPPVSRFLTWWDSPQRILGLFPEWFAPRQPDWPPQLVQTGFPLYDESDHLSLDADLSRWLDAGTPPVVFTPGSANTQASAFFAAAAEACARLGRRGLFVTKEPEKLTMTLPESIRVAGYVPFGLVFPRSAAVVHHGGVGTTAQALRAGVPSLVTPFSYDQFDNASRVIRLGAGAELPAARVTPGRLASALAGVLSSSVLDPARRAAGHFRGEDVVGASCDAVEKTGRGA